LRADGASVLAHPSTPSFTSIIPALAPLIEDEPMSALDLIRKADRPGAVNKRTLLMALTCPLSRNIMLDPVVCEDGFSYERKAITNYLRLHQVSPVTGERLSSETVLPNRLLLNMLRLHFPDALRRRSLPFFLQVCHLFVSFLDVCFRFYKCLCVFNSGSSLCYLQHLLVLASRRTDSSSRVLT
jgi:hypothetical protein